MTRLSVTQEEILATMRRIGEPVTFVDLVQDIRERTKNGDAHPSTLTGIKALVVEFFQLEELGRVRRVSKSCENWRAAHTNQNKNCATSRITRRSNGR